MTGISYLHPELGGFADEDWMALALREAITAFDEDEVPVGAVAVHEGRVIARAYNQCERLRDPTAHAEMLVITQAAESLGYPRLNDVTVFVTKEPCVMCAGALVHARVQRVVIGAPDVKVGACGTVLDVISHPALNHRIELAWGVREEECRQLLQEFFRRRRKTKSPDG
ncbi:MAG: tRNA adenosine(34) deaminase TadA [Planctomycetota bacterium]